MNRSLPVIAAVAIVLTGCAGQPRTPTLRSDAHAAPARALDACESVIYRAAASEADMALRCASVVGAWQ